ncbi:hypothetical protein CEXT_789341 [Caerostris extrusa]|uniref:Uncharacterized protein n=1 Tax=Caerostris extrusa TaxID=172846 RepID=A0AAV4VW33_CAEEX|nr:hypothetical protein CEXT_789341 [Caerostris extrusa]
MAEIIVNPRKPESGVNLKLDILCIIISNISEFFCFCVPFGDVDFHHYLQDIRNIKEQKIISNSLIWNDVTRLNPSAALATKKTSASPSSTCAMEPPDCPDGYDEDLRLCTAVKDLIQRTSQSY